MSNTENLELRMFGFVNYQLSGTIHAGIQFGHAVVEYGLKYFNTQEYQKWANDYKTFIILDGGTTNNNQLNFGTLNHYRELLINNNITIAEFHEPDLGDQLTAIVFIVDERVFNKTKYPDFDDDSEYHDILYKDWLKLIGGNRNEILRILLKDKKLA